MKVIPIRPEVGIMAEQKRGRFFVLDSDTMIRASEQGADAAAAYMALACGSGGDNTSTCWGAKSVAKYLGVRWRTADKAIKTLQQAGIVTLNGKVGVWNQYKIEREGDPIWLPRELVEGVVDNETGELRRGPIKQLRQAQDPLLILLLVDLYRAQNLWEGDGISTGVIFGRYECEKLGELEADDVWLFSLENTYSRSDNPIVEPHRKGKNIQPFFERFATLQSLDLVEWLACVTECKDGEPVFYIDSDMMMAIDSALEATLPEEYEYRAFQSCDYAVPIPRHMQQVQMHGMARLTFRPKTAATIQWYGEYMDMQREHIRRYRRMAGKPVIEDTDSAANHWRKDPLFRDAI